LERSESGVGHFTSDSATLFVVCSRFIDYLRLIVVDANMKTTNVNKMHNVWNFKVGFVQLSYDFRNLKVNVTFLNFNIMTEV